MHTKRAGPGMRAKVIQRGVVMGKVENEEKKGSTVYVCTGFHFSLESRRNKESDVFSVIHSAFASKGFEYTFLPPDSKDL